ncbi:MAG: hypothetical protein MJZ85_10745 [Bacteroidales bacterium]|nr:hypothetical protein [Bacteroidales bacterium]
MKKLRFLLLLAAVAMVFSSCNTTIKTAVSTNIETSVEQYPLVSDLVVGQKISKTTTWMWQLFDFIPFEDRRENLVADMLKEYNADVLVDMESQFEKTFLGRRSLTVTGYVATFKNFRNATEEDLRILEGNNNLEHKAKIHKILFWK